MRLKFMLEVKHMLNYSPNEEHLGGLYSVIYLSSYYGAKHVRSDSLSILAEFLWVHSALWNNVTKSMPEIILQYLEHYDRI